MKTEIDYEAIENSTGKITTGFRCEPQLKLELANEAIELGIKLSEHLENIVANRHKFKAELEQLNADFKKQQNDCRLKETEILRLTAVNETQKKELEELKLKAGQDSKRLALFNHPFLINLFDKLKGRDDTVEAVDGKKYSFKYNSPADVVEAMIYSFKLKN